MRPFALIEMLLVGCLAVALIVRPPSKYASAASAPPQPAVKMHVSEKKPFGNGTIRSWVRTIDGRPASIGVTFTKLPTGELGQTLVHLPTGVVVPPFTHVAIDPRSQAAEPRFDFDSGVITISVSMLGNSQRMQPIKPPTPFPPGYFPTSFSVKFDASSNECTIALEGLAAH